MEIIMGLAVALPIVTTTGISVTTGVAQGVSEQKKQNADAANQTRMLKFHLDVYIDVSQRSASRGGSQLFNSIVTLRNGKLYIEAKSPITRLPADVSHHPFTGFYLAYPDDERAFTRGLVSTISRDPPVLNWIYIDKDTLEVKYASRSGSIAHHVGSFDWTTEENEDSCVVFDDWEGFLAVEEAEGQWALYFDLRDDGLKGAMKGRRRVEVSLVRRVISDQEVNQWGLGSEGNIGFRKTREV